MIQSCDQRAERAGRTAVVVAFRPRVVRAAHVTGRRPAAPLRRGVVDLAKEPGLPDRLRALLNG